MNETDLGYIYIDDIGNVWQMTGYTDRPSAMLKNLRTGEEKWGDVDIAFKGFVKLVPRNECNRM